MSKLSWESLRYDVTASVVVFLVAIPLCLGIALASGAPLYSGLISGIIGGIIVGSLSESAISVSGPAAGMVAVVIAGISALGSFDAFLLALMLSGLIQIIIGIIRAGFIADYIPSNVIQGLLAAIGILIIIKQLPLAFGYFSESQNLMASLKEAQMGLHMSPLQHLLSHINSGATLITFISLGILIFWDKTRSVRLKLIPASVVVVIVGITLNGLYQLIWPSLTLYSTHLVNVPINHNLQGIIANFSYPSWSSWHNPDIYIYALTIALVGSLETLLNLEAAEKLDKTRKYCSRNRELVAQGVGNTIAGLIGGIPITSVIVRTSVNIQAGAKSKLSTILHGFFILIAVTTVPEWLNRIPLASLAAILIYTGYKLSKVSLYRAMYREGFPHFFPFIVTIVAIVFTNLLLGIIIGLVVSIFFILKYNSENSFDIVKENHPSRTVLKLLLPQQISFINKAAFITELGALPDNSNVVIDAHNTDYIDYDILELIKEFKENQAISKGITLNLIGFKSRYDIHDNINFINVMTYDTQSALTPIQTLTILKEGNQRFLSAQLIHRYIQHEIKATANGQHPIAVVLGCIDSRVPVETIFDLGLGDIFVARVAGNVVNKDMLASIEYACHVVGAKLIVVMGHTNCGAVKAACDAVEIGHITQLLQKIKPAIDAETETKKARNSDNKQFLARVTQLNIELASKEIYTQSKLIRDLCHKKSVGIIGALYNVQDGTVTFDEIEFNK